MIDRDRAVEIATKLRRQSRDTDVLALCDWVMTPSQHRQTGERSYKDYMREYMRKYRAKQKKGG